jgi:hypothetical protein
MSEKKGSLTQKINMHTRGQLDELLLSWGVCSCCAAENVFTLLDRKVMGAVCTRCGFEPVRYLYSNHLPFDYAGKPVNKLDMGKGLGGSLSEKDMWCVLAHSSAFEHDKRNLPMSAKFMKIMVHKYEHPRIASLLKYGRQLCHDYGYDPHRHEFASTGLDEHKRDVAIMFSNYFGGLVRDVGAYYVVRNERFNARKVADSCFIFALMKLRSIEEAVKASEKLQVANEYLDKVKQVIRQEEEVKEVMKKIEGEVVQP